MPIVKMLLQKEDPSLTALGNHEVGLLTNLWLSPSVTSGEFFKSDPSLSNYWTPPIGFQKARCAMHQFNLTNQPGSLKRLTVTAERVKALRRGPDLGHKDSWERQFRPV